MTEIFAEYDPTYMGTVQAGITRYFKEIDAKMKQSLNKGYAHTSLTNPKNVISIHREKKS